MRAWVQFFQPGAITRTEMFPVCGDRGVVILDARRSDAGLLEDAKASNGWRRPVYAGYRVYRGPRLFDDNNARLIGGTL